MTAEPMPADMVALYAELQRSLDAMAKPVAPTDSNALPWLDDINEGEDE
jgi:hypothetical protein